MKKSTKIWSGIALVLAGMSVAGAIVGPAHSAAKVTVQAPAPVQTVAPAPVKTISQEQLNLNLLSITITGKTKMDICTVFALDKQVAVTDMVAVEKNNPYLAIPADQMTAKLAATWLSGHCNA